MQLYNNYTTNESNVNNTVKSTGYAGGKSVYATSASKQKEKEQKTKNSCCCLLPDNKHTNFITQAKTKSKRMVFSTIKWGVGKLFKGSWWYIY